MKQLLQQPAVDRLPFSFVVCDRIERFWSGRFFCGNHWENTFISANPSDNGFCAALGESEKLENGVERLLSVL
jgi:hypothetical protein